MEQLDHENILNQSVNFPIVVIGEELRTPQNVGMGLRVSEAFGVQTFYLNDNSPNTDNRLVQRTARNTDKNIDIISYNDIIALISKLKKDGYTIIALEITDQSKNIHQHNFTTHQKLALLIGSERFGINPEALNHCDESIFIPMYGKNSSMNVINSLSVSLYEITKQLSTNNHL